MTRRGLRQLGLGLLGWPRRVWQRSGRRARWLLAGLAALVLVPLALVLVTCGYVWLVPYPEARLSRQGAESSLLTDRQGRPLRALTRQGGGRSGWVELQAIAPLAITATLAGEDHRFFQHRGVDARAVGRALWLALRHGKPVSGASTVTMQLARTLEPHGRNARGKLGEALAALRLERVRGKQALLEQYLNRVYYGAGAYGIEAAAQRFFGRPASQLSPGQATLLAVLPRWPSGYDPRRNLDRALRRRAHVLQLMQRQGWLSDQQRARIEAEPVQVLATRGHPGEAPHFTDWVLAGRERQGDGGSLDRQDAQRSVRTTLDLPLQRRLERAVTLHLQTRQTAGLRQAGVVVLDPRDGAVRAMVGSPDYQAVGGQLNITTTPRHPGSTLKPFIYALAIESGEHPASIARDERQAIPGYHPGRRVRERGPSRYREALAGSFNLAAVEVLSRVGVAALLERLRQAQLGPLAGTADDYGLDLALGSARVRLIDLAAAYGFLVQGGVMFPARALADQPPGPSTRLFDPVTSWLVLDMLADPGARRAVFGAELPLDLPFPVAAKTGTSSGFADTYTIAVTREAIVAAWAGAFDGSGTRGHLAMWSAAPLARAALLAVADLRGEPLTLPAAPEGVVAADVCPISGRLPGRACPRKRERFAAGHLPGEVCSGHPLTVQR